MRFTHIGGKHELVDVTVALNGYWSHWRIRIHSSFSKYTIRTCLPIPPSSVSSGAQILFLLPRWCVYFRFSWVLRGFYISPLISVALFTTIAYQAREFRLVIIADSAPSHKNETPPVTYFHATLFEAQPLGPFWSRVAPQQFHNKLAKVATSTQLHYPFLKKDLSAHTLFAYL